MHKPPVYSRTRAKQFFRYDPISSILLLAVVFLLSQAAAALVVSLYPALRDWTEAESRIWLTTSVTSQFLFVSVASLLSVTAVLRLTNVAQVTKAQIGIVRLKARDIGWAFIAYGLYFLCFLAVVTVAPLFLPGLDVAQEQQTGFENAFAGPEILMTFLALVVIVPLAEEIMFRGFLFSSLRAKFRLRYATVITGLLFGVAHLQFGADAPLLWVAAIDTFILSCFLCYLRERMGSVWPAVFLHAIKNSVAFILLFGARLL